MDNTTVTPHNVIHANRVNLV